MALTCPECHKISEEGAEQCDCGYRFIEPATGLKKCPYCAEMIRADAKKCRFCGEFLDGADSSRKGSEAIGTALLLVPLAAVFLILFWVGQMNLLQSPGSTLAALVCLTVLITGGLAAYEAGRIRTETSPITWFIGFLFLWIFVYPGYLFARRRCGRKNLVAGGVVVALAFSVSAVGMGFAIEQQQRKMRDAFGGITGAFSGLSGTSATPVAGTAPTEPPRDPLKGKWRTGSGTSSFDDSTTVTLSLDADNDITGWPGTSHRPTLILRCKEKKTEAYIVTGMQGKPEFGEYGSEIGTKMRGRYDTDSSRSYLMDKSTDGEAFFFPGAVPEIKRMLEHSSLVMEFTPFNSSPAEMRFDLTGLPNAITPLRQACGW